MQRTTSLSSAGSGSTGFTGNSAFSGASGTSRPASEAGDGAEDLAATELQGSLRGSLQEATFGVLYTLSKEKYIEGAKYLIIIMIVDYLQLAVFFIGNNFPWTMNFHKWYWKWLSWICFTNMFPRVYGLGNGNYTFYQVVFYSLTVILFVSFALCIFVGHNFKTGSFPWVWPIKVLKVAVSFFFEVFYISSLGIFCVSMDCTYYRAGVKVNEKFPQVECFKMPHLAAVVLSIVTSLLAMGMAYFIAVANSELNPINPEAAGQAHNRSAVKRFALISILTLINEMFPSYTKLQGAACIIITFYLCYNYIRHVPFQTPWVNGLQASFFASLTWASLVIVLTAFMYPKKTVPIFTILLWAGILPAVALAWCLLYYRLRWAHRVAQRFRVSLATKQPVIHRFIDELEVEVVARCARITDQWGGQVPEWIDTAEVVLKAGLEQFSDSAYLHIVYSSFLIEARKQNQRAAGLLELARKMEPGIGERFMLFVRDREQKQRQGAGGSDGSYDLLSYVEFQNSYKAILDSHSGALKAIRNFWRQLVRRDVKFSDITRAFVSMDAAEKRAELTYKTVLDKYPSSSKLLRAYGRFLEDVRSNPWGAQRYFAEAERLEQESSEEAADGGASGEDGGDRSLNQMVDDSADAVVVINDSGVIQFSNKMAAEMFGWGMTEMQGRNVTMLMGPPSSSHHNQYMQRYKKTGCPVVMNTTREIVALHKEGHSFRAMLTLKEVKQGDAKAYMGILKPVQADVHEACVWVGVAGQVVAIDKGFSDMFGWAAQDLTLEAASIIGADDGMANHLAIMADMLKKWEYKQEEVGKVFHRFTVKVRHKYGAAMEVDGEAALVGSQNMRTIMLKFLLDEKVESLGLLSISTSGAIIYCNASFEAILGYETGTLTAKHGTLAALVKGASSNMITKWLQTAARSIDSINIAPTSCRAGRVVLFNGRNNQPVPVRLAVEMALVGRMRVLTATVTKEAIPPADAWGGGSVEELVHSAKRIQLLVRGDGSILTFKADPRLLSQAFGQDPSSLIKKNLSDLLPDLQQPADWQPAKGCWPTEPQLIQRTAMHCSAVAANGGKAAFRVGVLPDASVMSLRTRMALGSSGTVASRLVVIPVGESEVDVQELVDEGFLTQQDVLVEGGLHLVEIWKEELLEATLEVDASLKIKSCDAEACMLLGYTREALRGKGITSLLTPQDYRLPHTARCDDFLGIKRTQLKRTSDASVSEKQSMEAQHGDGSTMAVEVQGADKHGDGSRWTLRVTVQAVQPQQQRPPLAEVLAKVGQGHLHSDSDSDHSEGPAEEDMRIEGVPTSKPTGKAASEASASEKDDGTSVGDGASVGAGSEGTSSSDFQRAKRFKKLNRMLNSPAARLVINALQKWSAVMLFAMVLLHIVLFAVTYQKVQTYNQFLTNTINSGEAAMMTQKLLYSSRIKMSAQDQSNPYSYYAHNATWAAELAAQYTPFVLHLADEVDIRVRWVFMGNSDKKQIETKLPAQQVMFISPIYPVQQLLQVAAPHVEDRNMSLFDFSRRFTTASRLMSVPPPEWANDLVGYTEYLLMRTNQPVLSDALDENLQMSEVQAQIGLKQQTTLMAIFMGCEAGLFVPLCCALLWVLLSLANRTRLRTFNVFVVLPRPVVLQLASKEIRLRIDVDDKEGDEEADGDDDAWLRQAQQTHQAAEDGALQKSSGVGYKFSSQRRKLTNNNLDAYRMLAPFMLWAAIVLLIYGLSIELLRGSIKPVDDLVAAQRLHYLVTRLVYTTQKMCVAPDPATAAAGATSVLSLASEVSEYKEALLYGNADLGLTGSILVGSAHEALWFGTGCMKANKSTCYVEGQPGGYYEETAYGLNRLMNAFLDAAVSLAKEDFGGQSLSAPRFRFLWAVGQDGGDLDDAMLQNTRDYTADGKKRMRTVNVIQILALVALALITFYFWFYQLRPFMKSAKQESRRVAELLSQLPPEMAVEELVAESANLEDNQEDKEAAKLRKQAAAAEVAAKKTKQQQQQQQQGAAGRGGGFFGLFRKSKVAPSPGGKEGGGLSIVVSNRTSKDKEGLIPTGAGGHEKMDKYKGYHEQMHRRHDPNNLDDTDDPALWLNRSPRKISFGPNMYNTAG